MDKNKEVKPIKSESNIIQTRELKNLPNEQIPLKIEKKQKLGTYFGALIIIVAGIFTGYFLSQSKPSSLGGTKVIETEKVVGSTDTKIFKDSAEGILEKGGIDGEGTHKLIRPGGESQTVYLTSSVIDLDKFVGKKVKAWGETFATEKAGWFMDVGRLEIIQ